MPDTYDIAVANSSHAREWRNKKVSWDGFCEMQREPRRTAETCAEYATATKAERDRWKNGPAFVGGYLEGGRRLKGSVRHRSMLALDADFADDALVGDWDMMVGASCIAWPTHSSGPRQLKMRVVSPLSRECSPEEYVPLALKVMEALGLDRFDPTTVQPERLMYSSSCSSDFDWKVWECEGGPLDVDAWLSEYTDWRDASCWPMAVKGVGEKAGRAGDPGEKTGVIGAFCRSYDIHEAISEFLGETYEKAGRNRYTFLGGSSFGGMRTYEDKWAWSDHATDPANDGHLKNAWDLVRTHRFGHLDMDCEEGTRQTSLPSHKAMSAWAVGLPEVSAELTRTQLSSAKADFADLSGTEDWEAQLEHEVRTGAVAPTANNIAMILANDPEVCGRIMRDVRTDVPVLHDCELPWRAVRGLSNWSDVDDAGLRVWFETKWGVQGRSKVADAVELEASHHPYDPVREYLEGLPPWDGTPRIDTLLVDHLGAEDSAYVRAVTRKLMCAAVRRALRPGCAFDYMVIVEGRQGLGKSKFLGDLGGEWFTDGVSIGDMARPKDAVEKMMGNWIVEIAELDGMAKTSIEALKAFVTTRTDNVRLPYAHRAGNYPRRNVLVGTVNNVNGYLRDASGNRRFWPVKCDGAYVLGTISGGLRDQVWAEAVEAEGTESLYLPRSLEPLAEAAQLEAMEEDPREWIVRAYLERPVPPELRNMSLEERDELFLGDFDPKVGEGWEPRDAVCVAEIWHEALRYQNTKASRADSYAITSMLRRLGWKPAGCSRTRAYGVAKTFERDAGRGRREA